MIPFTFGILIWLLFNEYAMKYLHLWPRAFSKVELFSELLSDNLRQVYSINISICKLMEILVVVQIIDFFASNRTEV